MKILTTPININLPALTPQDLIQEFSINLHRFTWKDLFSLLEQEITPIVKVIIRAAIHAKERDGSFTLTFERASKRVIQIENTRRKNFVRRTFKKWGLFAIAEINKSYPDYTSEMLPADLYVKKKVKCKALKYKDDFRSRQLSKYEIAYHSTKKDTPEFNRICERIASLTYADNKRLPIYLTVKIGNDKYVYSFHWNTDEKKIKAFHNLANQKGMTHEVLHQNRGIKFN